MSFVSFKFILFLGLTFLVFFVAPKRFQWIVLLLFSYLYYYLSSHKLIIDLFFISVLTFLMGLFIDKQEDKKTRRKISGFGIILVLLNLIVLKYSAFIINNINALFHSQIRFFDLLLPLGISYFTLQAISYLHDVARKKHPAETNLFRFLLYMAYFPQIVQGPIPKYNKLSQELYAQHDFDYVRICHGLQLMLWGIAKKIILADRLAIPVAKMFTEYAQFHGLFLFFAVVCYGFQIYADFSGGIDAIRGISEVFGIELDQNFRQPYFSHSVEEFWRRWHISLGAWMREYVFFPLSLSKRLNKAGKKIRKVFGDNFGKKFATFTAMFVVYLLVGIWHGPEWKYVVYGIWNGLFIMSGILLEETYSKVRIKLNMREDSRFWNAFRMIRTFIIVSFGRLIVRSQSVFDALNMLKAIFGDIFNLSSFNSETMLSLGINGREWILCGISVIVILFVDYLKEKGTDIRENIDKKNLVIRWALYLLLIMSMLVFGKYGPGYEAANFIYGNF